MKTIEQLISEVTWFDLPNKIKNILKLLKSSFDNRFTSIQQSITALQINTSITGFIDFTTMSNTTIYYNDIDPTLSVTQNLDDSITFTITNGGFVTDKTIPIMPGANILSMTNNAIQIETSTAPQLYFKIEVYI